MQSHPHQSQVEREKCLNTRLLDSHYNTSPRSPLHHDNTCKCGKKSEDYKPA